MEIARIPEEQQKGGQRERVHDLGLALEQDAQEEQEAHDGGAQDRGLPADDQGEGDQHDAGRERRAPARHADQCQGREDRGGQERHVEAGHREEVVDAGAAKALVGLARERGALAEEEPGEERRRRLGQPCADRLDGPALDGHGPGRNIGSQGTDAVASGVAHEEDAVPAELGRVVEAAGIPEADGPVEPHLRRDPLPLGERRRLAEYGELDAAGGEPPVGAVVVCLDVDEEPSAVRRPAHRLRDEAAFDGHGRGQSRAARYGPRR